MQKVIFISMIVLCSSFGFSQEVQDDASVEKSVFGIQTGPLGLFSIHNELKLSNQVALRSEIGLGDIGVFTDDDFDLSFFTTFSATLEPRWYYNLTKRVSKGKRIDGNSGNYLSLRASYYSYDLSELDEYNLNNPFVALNWGIRRNIGDHFIYEATLGGGLGFATDDGKRTIGFTPYTNLKIGYLF